MKRKLPVEFGKLFMLLLRKIWVFVIIMAVFIVGGSLRDRNDVSRTETYTATGKILVVQMSGEEEGDLTDNASQNQPIHDAIEILTTGSFLKSACDSLPFDMTVEELKSSVVIDQQTSTRVLNIHITGNTVDHVKDIMTGVLNTAHDYLSSIMPEVNVVILEDADTAFVQKNQSITNENGLKTGVLMGLVVCVITAFVFIVLYLTNSSIRYRDEAEDILEIPVIAAVRDKK